MHYLFVQIEFVDLWEDPSHAAITSAHQDSEVVKLLKQAQTGKNTTKPLIYLFCRISFQLKPNNKTGALWYLWIFTADLFASVFLTQGVAHRWPGQRLELGSEAAWSAVGTSLPGCRHFWSWQRPGGDWHMTGDRWPSRSLRSHGSSKNNKSQHGSVSPDWKQWNLHGKRT